MSNKQPNVQPGDWITVKKGTMNSWNAVVCSLYSISPKYPNSIEVVYLNRQGLTWQKKPSERKAFQTYVTWEEDMWQIADSNHPDGPADNYSRLAKFVKILRQEHYKRSF